MTTTNLTLNKQALLRDLPTAAEKYLGKRPHAVRHLGGGSFGKAFRLDFQSEPPVVIKAFRVEGMNETEAFALRLLGQHTRVPMPQVLFTAENLLGMSYIEGHDALTEPRFLVRPKALRGQFAQEVVAGMRDWHAVEGGKFGDLQHPQYDSWQACYSATVDEVLGRVRGMDFNRRQHATLEAAAAQLDTILAEDVGTPRLIHGDLNVMNIMADVRTFHVTGFIDPFNSMWADPEYDIFQLRNLTGGRYGLYDAYKARAKCSELVDLKTACYAAFNEALAYLRAGVKFEPNHIACDQRLRREMKRFGLKL